MKQEYFFKDAIWVGAPKRAYDAFSVLYGKFEVKAVCRATLNVLGLGFFKCYINGVCINPDSFLPLSSEYEASAEPEGEILSGHRIYVPSFDITPYIRQGENIIAVHYGGGWYCAAVRRFGLPKAIYSIQLAYADGVDQYGSNEDCLIAPSYIFSYDLVHSEGHNYIGCAPKFHEPPSGCERAVAVESLVTEYLQTNCPTDKLIGTHIPKRLGKGECGIVYDAGKNLTGCPVIQVRAKAAEEVTVRFSEALLPDGRLDPSHMHKQCFRVVSDGQQRSAHAEFTWFGFRYFEILGDAVPTGVLEIHADIGRTSSFESSNETLNWIYDTFMHTMLCNMHTGHPSDCPHLERRGYTGDGQLTCHAVLTTLDARAFYEKWLQDIADGQDTLSGHIQYTAPYVRSGGGPGGWGCAIVEVPYQLYLHYGDVQILKKYYTNMRRYVDYLKAHSEFALVTSDKAGEWCLGDWCGPNILYPDRDITSHNQQVILPAPMVNTYFMVKTLYRLCDIARLIGREEDIAEYEEEAQTRKRAIQAAYFNTFDGNFVMNVQGANAYAVDLGLGNEKTYSNMVSYYEKLGHFDTGIFATDILTRILFEHGDAELALRLLTANGAQGFAHWKENGATTFHEYWDSNRSRSHNHPMFGAALAYIFEYLLGIRQRPDTAGFGSVVIAPVATDQFDHMAGSIKTPHGTLSVAYRKDGGGITFRLSIPKNTQAQFSWKDKTVELTEGENTLTYPL